MINLFIFLAKFFLHKCKFQGAKPYFPVFCKDLKSYLDTLLTSNNSKALKAVSLCHFHNIHDFVTNNCIPNCTHPWHWLFHFLYVLLGI